MSDKLTAAESRERDALAESIYAKNVRMLEANMSAPDIGVQTYMNQHTSAVKEATEKIIARRGKR